MQLEFERTTEDLVAFNVYLLAHSAVSRRSLRTWRVISAVLAAAFAGGLNLLMPGYFSWVLLGAALSAGTAVYLIYPGLIRRATVGELRRVLKEGNNDAILGRQVLQLLPDGIHASNRSGEQRISWSALQGVGEGEKHLFLFTSSMTALVIPRSCFASDSDLRLFLQRVDQYRRAS